MAVLNWGDLAKSQVDPETIEEAIARLIVAHNANEESHLDTGQSLQSHKASEIIDHLARSVYRDKLIFNRFQIDESFETIDAWNKSAEVYLDQISQMSLVTTGAINNKQYAYIIPGDSMANAGIPECSPTWEIRVKIYDGTNHTAYIVQGDPTIPAGFGFKIINGNLYAVYWDGDSVEQTEQITGIIVTNWHNYRCEYISGVSLKWYVDGVLKKTLLTDLPIGFQIFMFLQIEATEAVYKILFVQSLHYDEDYSQ